MNLFNRILCKLFNHKFDYNPYIIKKIDGESKIVIPGYNKCKRCHESFTRQLLSYEVDSVIKYQAVIYYRK